jgi:acetyl esterase/lipase
VVNHYAGTDFAGLRGDAHPAGPPDGLAATEELVRLFLGFDPTLDEARRRTTDPLELAGRSPGAPPFLHMHGDADTRVGIGQSRRLHAGFVARGISSQLVVVPGAEHAGPEFAEPDRVAQVTRFLHEHW